MVNKNRGEGRAGFRRQVINDSILSKRGFGEASKPAPAILGFFCFSYIQPLTK